VCSNYFTSTMLWQSNDLIIILWLPPSTVLLNLNYYYYYTKFVDGNISLHIQRFIALCRYDSDFSYLFCLFIFLLRWYCRLLIYLSLIYFEYHTWLICESVLNCVCVRDRIFNKPCTSYLSYAVCLWPWTCFIVESSLFIVLSITIIIRYTVL